MLLLLEHLVACHRSEEIGFRTGSPADDLPEWIFPLLVSGFRPDGSVDGSGVHLLY